MGEVVRVYVVGVRCSGFRCLGFMCSGFRLGVRCFAFMCLGFRWSWLATQLFIYTVVRIYVWFRCLVVRYFGFG